MLAPADLTLPEPGSTSARRVVGAYLKRIVDDVLRLPVGRFRSPVFDGFAEVRSLLERLLRERRLGPVLSVLRRPTHSVLVRCLHAELWGNGDPTKLDGWLSELSAALAFELALAGELDPEGLELFEPPPRLLSLAHRFALELPADRTIGFRGTRIVIDGSELDLHALASGEQTPPEGLRLTRPYHPIDGDLVLALADNNPLSEFEAHPDKHGNSIDLGGRSLDEWTSALASALELIDRHLPELGAEIRLVMQMLVPVGYEPEKRLSASYAEAVGVAYLTLHPDPLTMAEAVIHEFSHNKLNALGALTDVLENAFSPLYPSPVRPDPRPLHGVLLAVHAFVPVARLYERMLEAGDERARSPAFESRLRAVVAGNHDGWRTLAEHARPTESGRPLLDELARWDAHFSRFR